MKAKSKQLNIIFTFLGIITIIIAWMVASVIVNDDVVLPSIALTFKKLGEIIIDGHSYVVLGYTAFRLIICVGISFVISLILASLSTRFNAFSYYIRPFITLFRTIPVVAIIIIILVYVGVKSASMVIASLVILPLMYEGIYSGMKNINANILDEIKIQSNINPYIIRKIFIPLIRPNLEVAVISSLGLGIKVLVMSEFIATPRFSIAKEMYNYTSALKLEGIFAWTIIMITFILIFEFIIKIINDKYEKNDN